MYPVMVGMELVTRQGISLRLAICLLPVQLTLEKTMSKQVYSAMARESLVSIGPRIFLPQSRPLHVIM